jgi:hypothetical protein
LHRGSFGAGGAARHFDRPASGPPPGPPAANFGTLQRFRWPDRPLDDDRLLIAKTALTTGRLECGQAGPGPARHFSEPNTFLRIALPVPTGSCLILRSSWPMTT